MKNHNLTFQSQRGLTLIEILTVLIILGLVMTFLAGKIFGAGDQAKANLTKIMLKDVQSNIEQFRLQYNSLPSSLEDLTRCSEKTGPGCIPMARLEQLKDSWGNQFAYALENGGRAYRIKSFGADGRDGGEGVNYDITVSGP